MGPNGAGKVPKSLLYLRNCGSRVKFSQTGKWETKNRNRKHFDQVKEEDLEHYRPAGLSSVHSKRIIEQILLETVPRPMENKEVTDDSKLGFSEGKLCDKFGGPAALTQVTKQQGTDSFLTTH